MDLNQIHKDLFKSWFEESLKELKKEFRAKTISDLKYLNRTEAADYLSVSLSTIDNYVRWGMLPKYKPKRGNYTRFKREDLDNILVNS